MSPLSDAQPTDGQPSIAAGDLTLRSWRPADAARVVKAFGEPDIREWNGEEIRDEDEALHWIERWREKWQGGTAAAWAITRTADQDAVLGHVALRALYRDGRMAECSYWVMPDYRGEGIAPRATKAMSAWALREFGLYRLEIVHSVRNRRSCRVALKAGFKPEGIKRSLQWHATGGVHDMHLHALTRTADTRARAWDRAALGFVSHVTLWSTASVLSAVWALLALVYPLAALLPVLLGAGVLSLRLVLVHAPEWRYRRQQRGRRRATAVHQQ